VNRASSTSAGATSTTGSLLERFFLPAIGMSPPFSTFHGHRAAAG
jgi:hypothetical protein